MLKKIHTVNVESIIHAKKEAGRAEQAGHVEHYPTRCPFWHPFSVNNSWRQVEIKIQTTASYLLLLLL